MSRFFILKGLGVLYIFVGVFSILITIIAVFLNWEQDIGTVFIFDPFVIFAGYNLYKRSKWGVILAIIPLVVILFTMIFTITFNMFMVVIMLLILLIASQWKIAV